MAHSLEEQFRQFRESLVNDVTRIDRVLCDVETQYHQAEYSQAGTVLKGLDGFLASKENLRKRGRSYKPEDRLFSLSSKTSPAVHEVNMPGQDMSDMPAMVGPPNSKKPHGAFAQKGYAQKGYAQKGKR